jgi:phosphatidylserine/phosphatidylglycerophosphate/cardiolipin synthase-like enzyme
MLTRVALGCFCVAILGAATVLACTTSCVRTPLITRSPAPPESTRAAFESIAGDGGRARLTLLDDNGDAWTARWAALAAAHESIDATYFIVEDDVFGVAFVAHLYARARAGVHVRLLVDGRGSLPITYDLDGADYLQELAAAGAQVQIFNPPFSEVLQSVLAMNLVPISAGTHNKTLVIDDRRAIVGGRNIGAAYFLPFREDQHAFVDFDVVLDGAAAARELKRSVTDEIVSSQDGVVTREMIDLVPRAEELLLIYAGMDAWLRGEVARAPVARAAAELEARALEHFSRLPDPGSRARARARFQELADYTHLWGTLDSTPEPSLDAEVRIVSARSRALENDDAVNRAFITCLGAAKRHIRIESPYFVLTPRLLTALQAASDRDVAITLYTNSAVSSDNDAAVAFFVDSLPEIMARVPTMRVFVPAGEQPLHQKRVTIDEQLTLVGTYNLDPFSAHMNSETIVGVWSREMNARTQKRLQRALAGALEYRLARDADGNIERYPRGHPFAGHPAMAFGPRDHTPRARIEEIEEYKETLLGIRDAWDFEVVVW